jgi:hypothetical protein
MRLCGPIGNLTVFDGGTMRIKVISYNGDKNDCVAALKDGSTVPFDPFVGCAILQTEKNYKDVGASIVGKFYEMPDDVQISCGSILPGENDLLEVDGFLNGGTNEIHQRVQTLSQQGSCNRSGGFLLDDESCALPS